MTRFQVIVLVSCVAFGGTIVISWMSSSQSDSGSINSESSYDVNNNTQTPANQTVDVDALYKKLDEQAQQLNIAMSKIQKLNDAVQQISASGSGFDTTPKEHHEDSHHAENSEVSKQQYSTQNTTTATYSVEQQYELEDIDDVWSSEAEAEIKNTFDSLTGIKGKIADVSCRSRTCKLNVYSESSKDAYEFARKFQHHLNWKNSNAVMKFEENADGQSYLKIYVNRSENVPQPPAHEH